MIAIIDYGMGNLRSVQKAFERVGASARITQNADEIALAHKIILPGVGAIKPSIDKLQELGLISVINQVIESKKPFLGICLGFQLLFDSSDEGGNAKGLGILRGTVKRFKQGKVPHMGWNQINITQPNKLFTNIENGSNVYFCHSFYVETQDKAIISTTTDYEIPFTSSIHLNNIYAVQFHPEKSQEIGLTMIKNFCELT